MRNPLVMFSLLSIPLLTSCGGSHPATATTSSKTGRATMTIRWPARNARVIPTAANSIVIALTQGSKTIASSGPITRPTSGGTSNWTTPDLAADSYTISAKAFPNSDGSGTVQASGTGSIAINGSSTVQADVTMGSTAAHVTLSASQLACRPGATVEVDARVTDATGAMVLVADSDLAWKSSDPSLLQLVLGGSQAIFQGLKKGSPTVTCAFIGVEGSLGQSPISTPSIPCSITAPGPATSWLLSDGNEQGNATTKAATLFSPQVAWTKSFLSEQSSDVRGIAPDGSVLISTDVAGLPQLVELNPDGSKKWQIPTDPISETTIASDGSIYVSQNQYITVLSGADGSGVASYYVSGNNIRSILLGNSGTIYWTASRGSSLNAFNPDGTTWSVTIGTVECDPVMDPAGNIYVAVNQGSQSGLLTSISPEGTVNWTTSLGLPFSGGLSAAQLVYGQNGNIYIGMNNISAENENSVVALNSTGSLLWTSRPVGYFVVDSKGNLYSNPDDPWSFASMVRLDAATGAETTIAQVQGGTTMRVQSISQTDTLYVCQQNPNNGPNSMLAYDTSGNVLWSTNLNQGGELSQEAKIAPDGSIYTMGLYVPLSKLSGSTTNTTGFSRH